MKLIRFGMPGKENPGLLDKQSNRRDASTLYPDWNRECFQQFGFDAMVNSLPSVELLPLVADTERWSACVARPGKVVCIGLNYSDHAAESGMPLPTEPIVFLKGTNTVVGPYDPLLIPRNSTKTDWEVELGIVIGKNARYLTAMEEATEYIAGYCISHDVSERAFQLERGGQWTKGKSCDHFNPLGPFLATTDEIKDAQNLQMGLKVNGRQMQTGNTSYMVFGCYYLVHYLSQFMTLEAGDVITTGTPPGVGHSMKPPQYLQAGDTVELFIDGLGNQQQLCVNA